MDIDELILECAKVPSFSTYEERLHPLIVDYISKYNHAIIDSIKDNNILVFLKGKKPGKPIAITCHLDKINHFGETSLSELNVQLYNGQYLGQMDNAVGVGVCLNLIEKSKKLPFPPLLLLFSEMEESMGLREHPHLLKNGGKDVGPQIGAKRLAAYIDAEGLNPATFITIDTTPVFKGDPGVALYTEYWEKGGETPEKPLLDRIEKLRESVLSCDPRIRLANGTNDYLIYGKHFGTAERGHVPSIAIEPAIFPYHQIGEGVFLEDVHRVVAILDHLLLNFDFSFS